MPLPAVPRPSARQECRISAEGWRRAVKAAEGLGLHHAGIPAMRIHLSSCTRNESSLSQTRLNHWKYQSNDEVMFPEQGTGARYRCTEKHAKKGLDVQAGGSGRQAPQAFVSFKNSLRLPRGFFLSLSAGSRDLGNTAGALNSLSGPLKEAQTLECIDLYSSLYKNKAELKL